MKQQVLHASPERSLKSTATTGLSAHPMNSRDVRAKDVLALSFDEVDGDGAACRGGKKGGKKSLFRRQDINSSQAVDGMELLLAGEA